MARKKHMSKEGISPLIATVLIIGFTIALAAIIYNWANVFVKDTTSGVQESSDAVLTCSQKIKLEIRKACIDATGLVELTVVNDADLDVDKFKVRITDTSGSITPSDLTTGVISFGASTLTVPTGVLNPAIVELIPVVTLEGGNQITCAEGSAKYGTETAGVLDAC